MDRERVGLEVVSGAGTENPQGEQGREPEGAAHR